MIPVHAADHDPAPRRRDAADTAADEDPGVHEARPDGPALEGGPGTPYARPPEAGAPLDPATDPTRMGNQPALTTSSGRSWLVMGALFALACCFPLSSLLVISPGRSFPVALTVAIAIGVCYLGMVIARFALPPGRRRLHAMAAGMIAMAAIALFGLLLCLLIEGTPV